VNRALKAVDAMDDTSSSAQAPVALASRLFCHCVQYYRTHEQSLTGHFLDGFCGDATDLDVLELGVYDKAKRCYTLDLLYGQLLDILSLSTTEQNTLSLEFLHKVAAQAARNGFGILTQSPFKSYYASLVRKSTTRDSKEHQANMKLVAQALGRESLERGMDRDIESKVAPEICAVFPLTARCNHSCAPNAQVRSQEFIDAHIDVVALRDLQPGEELLISYIPVGVGVGKRSTVQRRRELQAKYLFYCDCVRCTND
jgi:SET domain